MQTAAIRMFALLVPLMAAAVAWAMRRPREREAGAVFLATLWTLPALVAVNLVAVRMEWWSFAFEGGGFAGIPADLLIGWCLLWGALPALLPGRMPLWMLALLMAALDLLVMPACAPVVTLHSGWLWGELLAIAVALLPAQQLARWTAGDRRLMARATLQVFLFAGVMLFVMPAMLLQQTGGSWRPLLALPPLLRQLALQAAIIAAVIGLSAVQELAERGGGTPFPFDPPKRLVRSGLYAYLSNPMQLATALLFLLLAAALRSGWLAAAAAVTVIYSAGFAAWSERDELTRRWGSDWQEYATAVRAWVPRWRPAPFGTARLYVDVDCDPCSRIGSWITARKPFGLMVIPAALHPAIDLRRIRYEAPDGSSAEGVEAMARALEHLNFCWALTGCAARLPVARQLLQLIIDSVGGGPALVTRRSER